MDIQELQGNIRLRDFLRKNGFVLPKHEYSSDVLRLKSVLSDLRSIEELPECRAKADLKLNLENILTNGEPYILEAITQRATIKDLQAKISKLEDELRISKLGMSNKTFLITEHYNLILQSVQQLKELSFISEANKSVVNHVIFNLRSVIR